jgi:glycosyltransferase involved in cell wall biosynthesis
MSRRGTNPQKIRESATEPPAEITVAVLTYIPEQAGYFANVLEALKLCLASLRAHADRPFDLLVLDNGSCKEVRSFLYEELARGRIQYLIANTRNVGKMNAVFQMLAAAPGEVVFYTDGDIYYRPGWMAAHLEVLNTFPNVGLVGGTPLRNLAEYCTEGTLRWIESHAADLDYQKGDLIPAEWTREFLHSVGSDKTFEQWIHTQDCRVTYQGVTAYAGASHMQYAMRREVAQSIPRYRSDKAISNENDLHIDTFLERSGYLRLSTDRPYVYHIGNAISEDWLREEYRRLVEKSYTSSTDAPRRRHWFWGRSKVRRVLMAIYEWAFDLHYRNS